MKFNHNGSINQQLKMSTNNEDEKRITKLKQIIK